MAGRGRRVPALQRPAGTTGTARRSTSTSSASLDGRGRGNEWDPDSILHSAFVAGLIREPAQYRTGGCDPPGGLSPRDVAQAKVFYPPMDDTTNLELEPFRSQLVTLAPAQQANFNVLPTTTRTTFQNVRRVGHGHGAVEDQAVTCGTFRATTTAALSETPGSRSGWRPGGGRAPPSPVRERGQR